MHSSPFSALREEEAFYARYEWCLNPILSLGQLFRRLQEELRAAPALTAPWQRAEARINVYLFHCAIACIVDDYLGRRLADLSPLVAHFPSLRGALTLAQRLVAAAQAVRSVSIDRSVGRWRRRWDECVAGACAILVDEAEPDSESWVELESRVGALARFAFPARLLRRRMPLPAAFRNQDLTHHDVGVLARRVASSRAGSGQPLVVVGLRSAGSYFAPLLHANLAACGVPSASWIAIRPKQGLSFGERRRLRALRSTGAHVVLVDEPPNSGDTLRLALTILARAGLSADRVTVAVPRSPAKAGWTLELEAAGTPRPHLVTLDPPDYHKARLLEPGSIAPLLRDYCGPHVHVRESTAVAALNARLQAHSRDGFHVRLKRVFELQDGGKERPGSATHVVAKSVGWGWLGYHAYIAGTRLAGIVPRVIGVRHGLLFTEWVGEIPPRAEPDVPVHTLASYVAARARRLRLSEDPCFEDLAYGRTGWSELINLLRRAYGLYFGRLKIPALHRRLRHMLSPVPALIDGCMKPEEWVGDETDGGPRKADFEHHSFGKTELNVVDPAYDLACATRGFGLSADGERQLMEDYARQSGDAAVRDRVLLYQLLHGVLVMTDALGRAARDSSATRHEWNRRYLAARAFLTSRLSRFAASRIPAPRSVAWSKRLFFLDLDGVFDAELFGFPHTTASGLAALDLLRAHGFSVVLHTGRSVEDVRDYCRDYALPGGVAELGGVLVDAVAGREIPLTDDTAAEQLARCREVLAGLAGVCVDPAYRYAVRAYRYADERTVPLLRAHVEEVLRREGLDRLAVSPSSVDVIVLPRGVDKGHGLTAAQAYLGCGDESVAAIGDSDRDVPMLAAADFAFAPSGCSAAVRALAARGACRIMAAPMQRGLLRAARELARRLPGAGHEAAVEPPRSAAPASDLMERLLHVAERSRLRQLVGTLAWGSL